METVELPPSQLLKVQTKSSSVSSIAFHSHLPVLATGSYDDLTDETVQFFDFNLEKIGFIGWDSRKVNCVAFHPRLNVMLTGDARNAVILWEVESTLDNTTARELINLSGHTNGISCIAFHPTLPFLASGSQDKTVKIWRYNEHDWSKTECVNTLSEHTHNITSIAFHPTRSIFATSSRDNTAKLWMFDVIEGDGGNKVEVDCIATIRGASLDREGINSIAFHPGSNNHMLATGNDRYIKLWDYSHQLQKRIDTEPECISTLEGHRDAISCIVFHPTAPMVISGSKDKTVKLWFIPKKESETKCIETLTQHTAMVTSVAICPHRESLLATGSFDKTLVLYDIAELLTILKRRNSDYIKPDSNPYMERLHREYHPSIKLSTRRHKSMSKKSPSKKSPSKKMGSIAASINPSIIDDTMSVAFGETPLSPEFNRAIFDDKWQISTTCVNRVMAQLLENAKKPNVVNWTRYRDDLGGCCPDTLKKVAEKFTKQLLGSEKCRMMFREKLYEFACYVIIFYYLIHLEWDVYTKFISSFMKKCWELSAVSDQFIASKAFKKVIYHIDAFHIAIAMKKHEYMGIDVSKLHSIITGLGDLNPLQSIKKPHGGGGKYRKTVKSNIIRRNRRRLTRKK